jgi:hypothetical protein
MGVCVLLNNYENIYKSFLIFPIKVNSDKYLSIHGVLVPTNTKRYFILGKLIHSNYTPQSETILLRPSIRTKNGYLCEHDLIDSILRW